MPARERLPGRARRHHPRWDLLRVRIPKHVGDRQPERRPCRLPHIPGRHPVQAVRAARASRLCQGMWSCAVPARDSEAGGDTQPWPSSSAAGITQAARQSPAEPPRRPPCASTSGTPSNTTHDGAGQRDSLLLETRRADVARRLRAGPAAPVRRLARLLFRQADRLAQRAGRWSTARLQAPHGYRAHRAPAGHEVLVDDGPAAGQASPPLARNQTWPVPSSSASHCPAPGRRV